MHRELAITTATSLYSTEVAKTTTARRARGEGRPTVSTGFRMRVFSDLGPKTLRFLS